MALIEMFYDKIYSLDLTINLLTSIFSYFFWELLNIFQKSGKIPSLIDFEKNTLTWTDLVYI